MGSTQTLLKDGSLMKIPLNYYAVLAKRWAWVVILGVVLCSGASYGISKITTPVYQASTTLILNAPTTTSTNENFTVSVQAVPTYAQLLTSPVVLDPVAQRHHGLVPDQLKAMISAKPQPNTPLIVLYVQNQDPRLAMNLANEVSQSFAQFANAQLPDTVQILPAQLPTIPISPKVRENTGIGALVGLGLALALIVIFEWMEDRLKSPGEVKELLNMETLAVIPWLSSKQRTKRAEEIPALAEGYRILSANLNAAQKIRPFKLVMITSALAGEGKSSIAANLASFLAMSSKQVLLVDADLRSPALDQYFELEKRPKLANAFTNTRGEIEEYLDDQLTDIPNLQVMTAGVLPPNFMDLLPSPQGNLFLERLKRAPFDFVIFDTPPLLPAADAQILASYVQAIVLVVDPSKTPRKLLLRARHLLDKIRTPVLGVVINKNHWQEHGEIRQYLNDVRYHRTAFPPMNRQLDAPSMNRQFDTPSMNGRGDSSDVTLVLPSLQAKKENRE